MANFLKALGRLGAHALSRRASLDELGICLFQRSQLVEQPVEGLVRDLGIVEHVVTVIVVLDQLAQLAGV